MKKYTINIRTDKIREGGELYKKIDYLVEYFTKYYPRYENITVWVCDESTMAEAYNQCYAPGNDINFERDVGDFYAFRAFVEYSCRNICVFYTKYETPDSILWILAHEFAHYHIHKSQAFARYMRYKNQLAFAKYDFDPNYNDDIVHEMWFEEQFCNDFANFQSGAGDGDRCFDRVWWRNQKAIAAAAGKGE